MPGTPQLRPKTSRPRQLSLLPPPRKTHGGDERQGQRKLARPFDPKRPLHLTLRSEHAHGARSLLSPRHARTVELLTRKLAARRKVRVYRFVNVGNHLHLLVRGRDKIAFQAFLRELTGKLALLITGATKGKPFGKKFWSGLAWSRVVEWGRDFQTLLNYFVKNLFEATGHLGRVQKQAGHRVMTLHRDVRRP